MKSFSCSTQILMGAGAAEQLKDLGCNKLFLVADPFFVKNGWAERIGKTALEHIVFCDFTPDPTVAQVAEGVGQAEHFSPDAIVALGGGSALDCAKAIVCFLSADVPLIAIPTTSGSGSEVTDFAILTHDGVKHPLIDPKMRPKFAILDDVLLREMPAGLIADCGFDILAHALESWVGQNATPLTDALAQNAFATTLSLLPASFDGEQDVRLQLHIASTMAGLAFTQAGLGICHALSHVLGGKFHLPHGRLNAILLPAVVACNGCPKYARLARDIGLGGSSDAMALRNLKNALTRLRNRLKLPATLADAGIRMTSGEAEEIISGALADPCCSTNPIPVTEKLLHQVLEEVSGRG